jgi:hypothetical protein
MDMEQQFKNHVALQVGSMAVQLIDARAFIDLLTSQLDALKKEKEELRSRIGSGG